MIGEREGTRFCSRCGRRDAPSAAERVCPACGLGLMLWSAAGDAPCRSFAVVGSDMRVRAVSEAGERLFGREEGAVGAELPPGLRDRALERAIRRASLRVEAEGESVSAGSHRLRISTCGSPRAALVEVLEG